MSEYLTTTSLSSGEDILTTIMPNTSNVTEDTGDIPLALGERKWFIIMKYTFYSIIFLISLSGNMLVCYVVRRRMRQKTVTNNFIMNLAIADVLYTIIVPLDVYASVNQDWPYGSFMCRVLWPAQTLAITTSGFTLTALSVTRFWAVVNPLKRQISMKQSIIIIVFLWLLATSTVIPYIVFLKHTPELVCEEYWPTHGQRQIYTASLFVIQYAIPLTIIISSYIRIGVELTKGPKTENRILAKARGKEAKKVIKMLITVTLSFAILTLPSAIMWMWLDFGQADQKISSFWDIMDVLNIFDFLNCAANPIIYTFCNESFSRQFRRQLGCILPNAPPASSTDNTKLVTLVPNGSSPTSSGNVQKINPEKESKIIDTEHELLCNGNGNAENVI